VQGKERLLKKRSPQHKKPTNPNTEVPPQDAQLQGVVSMASIYNNQTQIVKLPPQDAQLQGAKPMVQYTTQKQRKVTKRKPPKGKCATSNELANHPQELNKIACNVT
jgi:hypothetical protein